MKLVEAQNKIATVHLSLDDLTALSNAINETLEVVEDWELSIRTGFGRVEYETLQKEIGSVIEILRGELPNNGQR